MRAGVPELVKLKYVQYKQQAALLNYSLSGFVTRLNNQTLPLLQPRTNARNPFN